MQQQPRGKLMQPLFFETPKGRGFKIHYDAARTPQDVPYQHAEKIAKECKLPIDAVDANHMSRGRFTIIVERPDEFKITSTLPEIFGVAKNLLKPVWYGTGVAMAQIVGWNKVSMYTIVTITCQEGDIKPLDGATPINGVEEWEPESMITRKLHIAATTKQPIIRTIEHAATTFGLQLVEEPMIMWVSPLSAD
jgi:hypothetical protein